MMQILFRSLLLSLSIAPVLAGAEEWEAVLQSSINSEYSGTRHNGLKQVDTKSARGLKALWNALAITNPDQVDWYVREGAYEALTNAEGEEAMTEIVRLLKAPGNDLAKEAVVYSVIWKIRKQFVKNFGGNDDRKIQEAKYLLRKKRGLEYFSLVLPCLKEVDPDGKRFDWLRVAFEDKSSRVRRAAITGFMAYPNNSSITLLIENLKRLEKKKSQNYREWVLTRFALEVLTGQYFRESVSDWVGWWEINKDRFGIEKRVQDELAKKEGEVQQRTTVVREAGVEVTLNMKVAGAKEGHPLLVLPWQGYEPDYFRPYFHGVEEFLRVYYVQMPQVDDFKGLPRDAKSNLIVYPTEILAKSLATMMKDSKLERYAVLGHGPESSISAMYLASYFPKQVTHLILMNPRSGGTEYGRAIASVRAEGGRRKCQEIVKGADSIQLIEDGKTHKYEPADAEEAAGLNRAIDNLTFDDPTTPEVGMIKFLYRLPGGSGMINDEAWSVKKIFNKQKPKIPVMVVLGEKDPWTPVGDMMRVVGVFDKPYLAKFPQSSETPFLTETYAFTQHLEKFFGPLAKSLASKSGGKAASKTGKTKVAEKTDKKPEVKKEEKKEEPPPEPEPEPGEKGDDPGDDPERS